MTEDWYKYCEHLLETGFCALDVVQENGDIGHGLCIWRLQQDVGSPARCPQLAKPGKEWLCGNCGTVNEPASIECSGCHGIFTSRKDPSGEDAEHRTRVHYTKQDQTLREAGG